MLHHSIVKGALAVLEVFTGKCLEAQFYTVHPSAYSKIMMVGFRGVGWGKGGLSMQGPLVRKADSDRMITTDIRGS